VDDFHYDHQKAHGSTINPVDFVQFIQVTMDMITRFYDEHPQPISTSYFWYYQGAFTKIEVSIEDNVPVVLAPEGLAALMTETEE